MDVTRPGNNLWNGLYRPLLADYTDARLFKEQLQANCVLLLLGHLYPREIWGLCCFSQKSAWYFVKDSFLQASWVPLAFLPSWGLSFAPIKADSDTVRFPFSLRLRCELETLFKQMRPRPDATKTFSDFMGLLVLQIWGTHGLQRKQKKTREERRAQPCDASSPRKRHRADAFSFPTNS